MKHLVYNIACGNYYSKSNNKIGEFILGNYSDNLNIIFYFFEKYPILGVKTKDF